MPTNCNCYRCGQSICDNECTCTDPDYSALGCINNNTECILYNGDTLPNLSIVKNNDMNVILQHISDIITTLTNANADLQTQVDDVTNNTTFTTKVTISSAEILQLFTTPKTLVAAQGAGTILIPLRVLIYYHYGSIAYATNTTINIHAGTLYSGDLLDCLNQTEAALSTSNLVGANSVPIPADTIDKPILLTVSTGNPTAGDGTVDVYITYAIQIL